MTHTCAAPCDFKFRIDTIKQLQQIQPIQNFKYVKLGKSTRHARNFQRLNPSRQLKSIPNIHLVIHLFRTFKTNILSTGYCLVKDFRDSWNMGILDGKCYFLDLDEIAVFSKYKQTRPNPRKLLFLFSGELMVSKIENMARRRSQKPKFILT